MVSLRMKRWLPLGRELGCSRRGRKPSHSCLPHPLVVAARRCGLGSCEGEEAGATPDGTGDGAGDGGEAAIGRALPVKAIGSDRYGMALALIVAHQHRAGLELAPRRAALAR